MKPIEEADVGIAGFGLMGGAFAMALRRVGATSISAFDIDRDALREGLKDGVIDKGSINPKEVFTSADLIFLCLPPTALLNFLKEHMALFKPHAILTDIAGTKSAIARFATEDLRGDIDFIPGHPMAGSEKDGYSCAKSCNFIGKNYILTPLKRNLPQNLAFLKGLILRMGFSRITEISPLEHDLKVAFTSQLCHMIAAALIDSEKDTSITKFGGGSFEDLTRIAMINAPLWTELFLDNKQALLKRIEQFEGSFQKLKMFIANDEGKLLEQTLSEVRRRRQEMI